MYDADRQYPLGKFSPKENYTLEEIKENIGKIESFPEKINQVFQKFTTTLLDTPYRKDGWTGRQVFHHLSDSHLNAYIRCKWTLTEDTPVIKAYNEKAWAETSEISGDPVLSVALLMVLHQKWAMLLRTLSPADFQKSFIHPETNKAVRLDRLVALYAWHGEHHLAHLNLILS